MAKRFLAKLLSVSCAFTMMLSSSVFASNLAKINSPVNLRSYNSTSGYVVGVANKDETVTILSNANNGWFQVKRSDGSTGFISTDFMQVIQTDATCIEADVNVRTAPAANASILGKAKKGQVFVTSGKSGDWYIIKFNNNTGYIHKDFMQGSLLQFLPALAAPTATASTSTTAQAQILPDTKNVYAVIDATSLNLRQAPSLDSQAIKALPQGYSVTVNGYENGWIKVTDDTNTTGYVSADYVTLKNGTKPVNAVIASPNAAGTKVVYGNNGSVKGTNLVNFAKKYIGTPYVWGGTDLENGVDCSGFVFSVYKNFGITLLRTSREMYTQGTSVDQANLAAGDLVFFNSGGNSEISHVGMYIGNGQYIHSTNGAANSVTISDLDSAYAVKTYVGAKRILK